MSHSRLAAIAALGLATVLVAPGAQRPPGPKDGGPPAAGEFQHPSAGREGAAPRPDQFDRGDLHRLNFLLLRLHRESTDLLRREDEERRRSERLASLPSDPEPTETSLRMQRINQLRLELIALEKEQLLEGFRMRAATLLAVGDRVRERFGGEIPDGPVGQMAKERLALLERLYAASGTFDSLHEALEEELDSLGTPVEARRQREIEVLRQRLRDLEGESIPGGLGWEEGPPFRRGRFGSPPRRGVPPPPVNGTEAPAPPTHGEE